MLEYCVYFVKSENLIKQLPNFTEKRRNKILIVFFKVCPLSLPHLYYYYFLLFTPHESSTSTRTTLFGPLLNNIVFMLANTSVV